MKNYFKKFSIMFVMLLVVVGIGAIQNGSVANAATVGQQLTSPESGWKRYDDSDSNIEYSSKFYIWENTTLYKQKRHQIYQLTNKDTQYIKFAFYGSELRLIDLENAIRTKNSTISFDEGKTFETCSAYGTDSAVQSLFYEKTGLEKKIHNVIIKIPYESYEKAFCLDCVDIDDDGYLLAYDKYSEDESISLDKSSMNLTAGDTEQLKVSTTPASVGVTWKSSDESVASVDSTGKVTGIKVGQATIAATTTDGSNLSASCIVTVTPKSVVPTPTDSDNIVNIAHAKGDNTNNAGGGVTIIFNGVADATLSVVKTADVKSVYVGDTFTYTIVVSNTSTKTAKAVVINDSAPNHIDFTVGGITTTQGKVDLSSTSKNIIVNVGDIPALGTVTIKIPATVIL